MYKKDYILKIENLMYSYGDSQVIFDLNMNCKKVGITAILGRNGAGKSTLLKTISGEVSYSEGQIIYDGIETKFESQDIRCLRGIGYVPQENAVFGSLTVHENLLLGGISLKEKCDIDVVLDYFPKLSQRLNQQAGTLSGGERKMLAISRSLLGKPKLLLLDEPTEGVWIGVIEEISQILQKLSKDLAIILVEQHVKLALDVSNYVYVMDRGRVAMQGDSIKMKDNPKLLKLLAP